MNAEFADKFQSDQLDSCNTITILLDAISEVDPWCSSFSFELQNNIRDIDVIGYINKPFKIIDNATWEIHYESQDPDFFGIKKTSIITGYQSDIHEYCRKMVDKIPDISHRYNLLSKLGAFK